ncbi:adenine nucleotide alpha hydrolase family protein [Alkalicoccobacillus murimartini]|uniref:K+-sensing histidine kinase KdpD n=1 Tax=Alkalicoccobacillus murimartini TaxID=171685 RepID=A0ABT9YLU4_9BACI|nr:hypothetical protein [Alkalicoccobacillus murimartini]MDQ0208832.1 K+-sensing histidine kinase KdpD [Alkalicoccobacillus murimartini]
MNMEEKIMVCHISENQSGDPLLKRGVELSQMFDSPLCILYLSGQSEKEQEYKDQLDRLGCQKLVDDNRMSSIFQTYNGQDKLPQIILDKARENQITQLVIGQCSQSRWELLKKGDFVNRLVSKMGDIDLHIVPVSK